MDTENGRVEVHCRWCVSYLKVMDVWDDIYFLACTGCEKSYTYYKSKLLNLM